MERVEKVRSFRDLIVWRKSFELALDVYRATESFPTSERFGIVREQRATARSVLYNIAEGHKRRTTREYIRFLDIARGSAAELETQLLLSRALSYLNEAAFDLLAKRLAEVQRMLDGLISRLTPRARAGPSAD